MGKTGHRITGNIASAHLDQKAQKESRLILGDKSIAVSSTWMD